MGYGSRSARCSLRLGGQHAAMGVHVNLHGYLVVGRRISGRPGARNDRFRDGSLTVRRSGRGRVGNAQVGAEFGTPQDDAVETDAFHAPPIDILALDESLHALRLAVLDQSMRRAV